MKFLRYIIVITLALTFVPSLAQQASDFSPAHQLAVRRMLNAMKAEQLVLLGMKKGLEGATDSNAAIFKELVGSIKPDEAVSRLVPIYAKYYSQEQAQSLAKFYESPVGTKLILAAVKQFEAADPNSLIKSDPKFDPSSLDLTREDTKFLEEFGKTPAARLFAVSNKKVNEESKRMFVEWGGELMKTRLKKAFAPAVNQIESILDGDPMAGSQAGVQATKESNGVFDQLGAATRDSAKRTSDIMLRYQTDLKAIGLNTLLAPASLATETGIAEGKQKIQKASESLDRYVQSANDAQDLFLKQVRAIPYPASMRDELMRNFESGLSKSYERRLKYEEIQRNLVDLFRRTYDFAESRQGKVNIRNGKLVFDNNEDLEIYRSLMAQIDKESAKEDELVKEAKDRVKETMQQFR
jgi:hypothetical protein